MTKTFILLNPVKEEYVQAYFHCTSKNFSDYGQTITGYAKQNGLSKSLLFKIIKSGITESPSNNYFLTEAFEYWQKIINDVVSQEHGLLELSIKHGTNPRTIKKNLIYFNLDDTILKDFRFTVEFNRKKFLENTAEKWYWIGFILADGYVKKNELVIKLGERDIDHLKKFCKFMELDESHIKFESNSHSSYTTKKSVTTVKVVLNDAEMLEYLRTLNITTAKSCKEIPPNKIPKKFVKDFIRGVFDGDGSIRSNLHGVTIVGSVTLLSWIVEKSLASLPTLRKADVIKQHTTKENELHYIGWYSLADKKSFLHWLYNESTIYLDRKYILYEKIWRL